MRCGGGGSGPLIELRLKEVLMKVEGRRTRIDARRPWSTPLADESGGHESRLQRFDVFVVLRGEEGTALGARRAGRTARRNGS